MVNFKYLGTKVTNQKSARKNKNKNTTFRIHFLPFNLEYRIPSIQKCDFNEKISYK
jgi:hypothetical protein